MTQISPSTPGTTGPDSSTILTDTPRHGRPTERNLPEGSARSGVLRGQMATASVASASP